MSKGWEAQAKAAEAARRSPWFWSPVSCALGGLGLLGGWHLGGALGWAAGIAGAALALWGFLFGTLIYMRRIDEQERDANLWGCYVGMCAYLVLFPASYAAAQLGHPVPHADVGIFFAVMFIVLGVFAWKRFR